MTAPDYRSTLEYLRPFRTRVSLLAAVLIIGIGFELGAPLILRRFIDAALGSIVVESLATLGVLYLVARSIVLEGFARDWEKVPKGESGRPLAGPPSTERYSTAQ